MLISRLRHQVKFYKREYVPNDWNEPIYKYVPAFIEWGEVRSVPGEEFRNAVFTFSKVPYRVLIRYREGIDAMMKIRNLTDSMVMDIEAIRDPDGKRELLEIQCLWRENDQDTIED